MTVQIERRRWTTDEYHKMVVPASGEYETVRRMQTGDSISPVALYDIEIAIEDILL